MRYYLANAKMNASVVRAYFPCNFLFFSSIFCVIASYYPPNQNFIVVKSVCCAMFERVFCEKNISCILRAENSRYIPLSLHTFLCCITSEDFSSSDGGGEGVGTKNQPGTVMECEKSLFCSSFTLTNQTRQILHYPNVLKGRRKLRSIWWKFLKEVKVTVGQGEGAIEVNLGWQFL